MTAAIFILVFFVVFFGIRITNHLDYIEKEINDIKKD